MVGGSTEGVEAVAAAIREARSVICLSGAGVSVPSGIPDFRSPGGLWTRMDPMEYATLDALNEDPAKVWSLFREIEALTRDARPNAAHTALARLEAEGFLELLITQNVDGLHQAAGSRRVVELHGNGRRTRCMRCLRTEVREPGESIGDGVPRCECGGVLKLDVTLFGESLPMDAIRGAVTAAEQADLILVVGTSATVVPASTVPHIVLSNGGRVVEMNLERTVLSDRASFCLQGDLTHTLPALTSALSP